MGKQLGILLAFYGQHHGFDEATVLLWADTYIFLDPSQSTPTSVDESGDLILDG